MKLTIGKIRGLQQIASPHGIFTMCAMDHRESLLKMLTEQRKHQAGYEEMAELKIELCSALGEHSSAVLLDPIYGAAQCIAASVLPKNTGLLVSVEASGYGGGKENRVTEVLPGWGVEKIKRMGASAVKILVYYRPDLGDLTKQQLKTIAKLAEECIKYDIPYLVEQVSYPVGSEINDPAAFAAHKGQLVIDTARDITALPIDILKAEFPADLRYQQDKGELLELCYQVNAASRVPWVILSGGVDFDTFAQQVEIASRAGASGFLGGRAIWQECLKINDARERRKWLFTVAVERMEKLCDVAEKYAVPWYKRLNLGARELSTLSENWHKEY